MSVRARRGSDRAHGLVSRLAGTVAVMMAASGLAAGQVGVASAASAAPAANAPPAHDVRPVTGLTPVGFRPVKVSDQTRRGFTATAITWPSPASGVVELAAPSAGQRAGAAVSAAGTPAWAQAVAPAHGAFSGPSSVHVSVAAHGLSGRLGISGVVWSVSGLTAGSGGIRAGLDYKRFAQAYGGNFGSRLRLVELPGCALTTPQLARCRTRTPLPSVNDAKTSSVSAVVPLPAQNAVLPAGGSAGSGVATVPPAAAASAVVLAAASTTAGEGGPAGTYGATSLKPAGSWAEGGASGSFTYSYPITVPAASSPLVPSVALSYDSGTVDGQTAATQAQANWAGDGWSTGDSFVEQSFIPCADNPQGVTLPSADQTQDMCYDGNVLTLSLDGKTTSMVYDSSSSTWRLQDDNGATIDHVTGSGNGSGTYNSDYWVITQRDGQKYYFGLNHLPGWASGDTATNSVDSEPVYSPSSGDPCYSSAGFTSSVCTMGYRWHLDYVTDTHGDAMAYHYAQDTNYYGQDNGAKNVSYIRDSYLKEIDYGFRVGGAYGTIPDKVVYGASARCVQSSCPAISSSNAATDYPDVPYDLVCASGATCGAYGPGYFSQVRLTSITTEQYSVSAAGYEQVDSYALNQTEPATGDGTAPTLWLASIGRTGEDTSAGGSSASIPLPAVHFSGTDLKNRVDTTNFPGLYRYRITSVTTEMGAVIGVTYETPDTCTAAYVLAETASAAASNTKSCYPVWWTPAGYTAPVLDWFEKYAVQQVLTSDQTGGALTEATSYKYSGGAAWHYDDNEVVKARYRTYGQFRGFGAVETLTGDGVNDPQTESVTSYYRGMSDDNNSTAVSLTDSQGGSHDDAGPLAGLPLETTAYLGAGGPVDHSTITSYWVSAATATRSRSGLPALTANMAEPAEVWTRQALTDGGTTSWRYTETDTTYVASVTSPSFGLATYAYSHTVPASSPYNRCTASTYAPVNTSENLAGLTASTETDSVACSGFTEGSPPSVPSGLNTLGVPSSVTRPDQVVSAAQTFYDDTSFSTTFPQATAPTTGNVTMTRKAGTYASGAFTWQTTARDTYDSYGRVQDAYDGNGNKTTTAYTVNTAGLTTAESVTNPLGQATSQTLDPTRNLALTATDVNGVVTTSQYDALGRVTSVWLDSRAVTAVANDTYAYTISGNSLSGVVAQKMGENLSYAATVTILDALGRTREVQTSSSKGGRLITDQVYDSRGWVWKKNNNYWDSSTAPTLSLDSVADGQVPNQDEYTFDGLGRTVADVSRNAAKTVSTTTTVYNGDRTTVIPPAGGVTKATATDPMGRTSETDEYTSAPTLATPSSTFTGIWYVTGGTTTATKYGFDGHGNQATITDAASHQWTSTYDLLGRVTGKTDPDTGSSSMVYDGDGNLTQETDARAKTVSYTYDALSRKTAEYAAPVASQSPSNQTASWVYDNSNAAVAGMKYPVGHVTTETTYSGGSAYVLQASGFNVYGESLGETVTIPSAEGALAGSYTFSHAYTTGVGLAYSDTYPAAGGLPAETTVHSYLSSPLDLPKGLGGSIDGYADLTSYDAFGHLLSGQIGSGSNYATLINTYDSHTGLLTDQTVTRHVSTPANVDEETYSYDLYGNITQQVSTRLGSSSPSETQCFGYDGLDRLTAAWTATGGCAATPTSASHSTVGDPLGTASEYWTTWTYDALGDRTGETDHSVTGGSDTTTAYTYNGNSAGQPHTLTSAAVTGGSSSSSTFGYDAAGNMTARTTPASGAQTLAWNEAGQLASVTGTGGTTSYLYTPDGDLLLRKDPAATTLFLPGEELTLTPAGAESGIRYIPLPSGGQVVRTGGTTSYYFEVPDLHGTSTLYLDNTAQSPTWRQFTPFGAPRGTPVTWIDPHGFLNKPADPATGLTDVGAREYDPLTGQFISPDPVLNPADPQDLDPYAYALGNPVTNADPTGLMVPGQSLCTGSSNCNKPGGGPPPGWSGPGNSDPPPGPGPGPGPGTSTVPVASIVSGLPNHAQIVAYYNARLVQYASSYGPHIPAYLQWQALSQACYLSPGLCPSYLGPNALHQFALAHDAYLAASSAMLGQQARGGGASILLVAGFAVVAVTAPELIAAALPEAGADAAAAGSEAAAEEGASAAAADQSALDYATTSSKLDHIFAVKHNFDPLVEQFGSREAVVQQFVNGLKGLTPESGTFAEQIVVGGQKVIVRGAVVNGVTKIGTAFTP